MSFSDWLSTWLARHPLKMPTDHEPSRYTAEVMERVRALGQPAPMPWPSLRWLGWPRLGLAAAMAGVAVWLVVVTTHRTTTQLADAVVKEFQVLAALTPDAVVRPVAVSDSEALAREMELHDTMILAESQPSDDQWIDQTLQLFDRLDQEIPPTTPGTSSDEQELWNELQLFDDNEPSASS